MKRRIFIFFVALALGVSAAAGVIYARANGSTDKPTMKVIVVFKSQAAASTVMSTDARRATSTSRGWLASRRTKRWW